LVLKSFYPLKTSADFSFVRAIFEWPEFLSNEEIKSAAGAFLDFRTFEGN